MGSNKIPTAEEFLNSKYTELYEKHHKSFKDIVSLQAYLNLNVKGRMNGVENNFVDMLIEFTKLHVEAQKQAIKKELQEGLETFGISLTDDFKLETTGNNLIEISYSLENIK